MAVDEWEAEDQWDQAAGQYYGQQDGMEVGEPTTYDAWGQAEVRVKSMRMDFPVDVGEDDGVLLPIELPDVE